MILRLLSAADSLRPLLAAARQGPRSPDASSAALGTCAGSVCGMREEARGLPCLGQACAFRGCAAAEAAAGGAAHSESRADAGWPGSSAAAFCSTASRDGLHGSTQGAGPAAGLGPEGELEYPRQPDSAEPRGRAEHAGYAGVPGPAGALEGDGHRRCGGGEGMPDHVQGQCHTAGLGLAEALDRRMAAAAGPAWAPEPELILVSRAAPP